VRSLLLAAAALAAAAPLAAQERPAESPQERVHVVRSGDTLWDIARAHLSDPFLWPEIFRLNTDVVQNPARIFPSERLRLPGYRDGATASAPGTLEPGRTVFFPREGASDSQVRHVVRPAGTADVPVLTQGDYYRAGFLARERDVRPVGYLADRLSPSVTRSELAAQIQLYDQVYIALAAADGVRPGDRLHFFRPGREVRRHGRIFQPTGIATIAAVERDVATAVVIQIYGAMTVGDLALPLPNFPVPAGVAPLAEAGPAGTIVAFQSLNALHMTQDIAFLDVGHGVGIREGDEFAVYLPAERRRWGVRPEVEVARLQVVRAGDRISAARVVTLEYPALEPGLAVRRVARMP
jgi:hypothetical protein